MALSDWYRGNLPPNARTPLQLLMIQSTSFCNIDCAYCYLPLRDSKARFDLDRLPALIAKLDEAGLIDRDLSIAWHAGEPLVMPVDWYERAFDIVAASVRPDVTVHHHIQTNAILLTDAYAQFFKRRGVMVGVSIDGPADIHDKRRVTRDGRGTFDRTMAGIDRLKAAGVPFSTISVVAADSLDKADELYAFFKALGPMQAGFNIEEIEGSHDHSSLDVAGVDQRVRAFYRRLAHHIRLDPQPMRIREFDRDRGISLTASAGPGGSSENNPLSIISVDTEGRISTFSPELLQVPGETDAYTFGTIENIDFTRLWSNNHFASVEADIRRGVEMCRESCGYFDHCHGGAPANKLAEHGRFDSTETMHCRLTRQALTDVVEEALITQLQQRQAARITPRTAPNVEPAATPVPTRMVRGAPLAPAPVATLRIVGAGASPRIVGGGTPAAPAARGQSLGFELGAVMGAGRTASTPRASAAHDWPADPGPRPRLSPLFPHVGALNIFAPLSRLGISPATEAAPTDAGYKPNARLPVAAWFPLTREEQQALASDTRAPGALNFAALVPLPDEARRLALQLGAAVAGGNGPVDGGALQQQLADLIRDSFDPGPDARVLGTLVQAGGQRTTTIDPTDGLRQGLHVDSWSRLDPDRRSGALNRISINCGPAPRRLLLLDLSVEQIAGLLGKVDNPTDMARHYLALHRDYPVLSIEVRPGEAYVAATENIVHDGCSLGHQGPDISFTMLGAFRRDRMRRYAREAEAIAAR